MVQTKILEAMAKNKKNLRIGGETFNISFSEGGVKAGKPLKEIMKEMRKASNEQLIRVSDSASFS